MTGLLAQPYATLIENGGGELDHSALLTMLEMQSGFSLPVGEG